MILDIDAGNTFIKWRLRNDAGTVHSAKVLTQDIENINTECWSSDIEEVRIASVAGSEVNAALAEIIQVSCGCQPFFAKTVAECAGVRNSYKDPARMGVDRWLVMLAAYSAAKKACCVVDCGSAITVDFLGDNGAHLGGYIMPGLRLMGRSLLSDTAEIIVDQDIEHFDISPGTSTSTAVTHGVNYVFQAIQEKILHDIELNNPNQNLFITGGDGLLFQGLCAQGDYIEDLVMDGLKLSEWRS